MSEQNPKHISKGLSDLLITDVFLKHGVEQKKRNLTPEQKEQVRNLVQDLQAQVEQYLQKTQETKPIITPANSAPSPEKTEPERQRRRLALPKKQDGKARDN
jgi:spore coat protein W